jgi:hypothetical protein
MVAAGALAAFTGHGPAAQAAQAPISDAIRRAVAFVRGSQERDGAFQTLAWLFALPDQKVPTTTPFTAAQVMLSLRFAPGGDEVRPVIDRAASFLLARRDPPGVWRFWRREMLPVSADADDTALAWAALVGSGYRPPDEVIQSFMNSRLPSGMFATWFGDPSTWPYVDANNRKLDLVVNANVLLALSLAGRAADDVCARTVQLTRAHAFVEPSPYYPSPLAYTFALSRAWADGGASCLGDAMPVIRAYVLGEQRPAGDWGDDLDTVLATLTLLNAPGNDNAIGRGMQVLFGRQRSDGGWALDPAYIGASLVFGSRAWTTALAIEALAKYSGRRG